MIISTENGHAGDEGGLMNGTIQAIKSKLNGNGSGRFAGMSSRQGERPRPQETFAETVFEPNSFFGKLRALYSGQVLQTQLEQLRKQGSYDAFKLEWKEVYNVRRLHKGNSRTDNIPPSLFWESDVGKWIEATCYFLSSPDGQSCEHAAEFETCVQELVDMIEKAQQPDGYLDIYFTVVDPEGRFMNLRDFHEMYNAGHLLEGAMAHYKYTGSRQFLNVMIRYIDCFIKHFGPNDDQLHGYPGHPELELAVLRLYHLTGEQRFFDFAHYLLAARGVKRADQGGDAYFEYEAKVRRRDDVVPHTMNDIHDQSYNQSHLPLHDQDTILGHSVRALYLTTAAADIGGEFLDDAKRLLADAIDHKMYVTGGLGTEPKIEGFSAVPYRLPQSTNEGGCYAETCASIACMMTAERVLSYDLDGKIRDTMELCLLNAVMGGGSLDGRAFAYANKLATCNDETATRADWFEVCCCPPNLSRTLGMLGGYTWSAATENNNVKLDVYLFLSATRTVTFGDGRHGSVKMTSGMPWVGETKWDFTGPEGTSWEVRVPVPAYARDIKFSVDAKPAQSGFVSFTVPSNSSVTMSCALPVRLLAPHVKSGQDTLTVTRGPIVYVAESYDNPEIDDAYPHFEEIGLAPSTQFEEVKLDIQGFEVVGLRTKEPVYALGQGKDGDAYREVNASIPARTWKKLDKGLTFVPWFARANRGGAGRVRTSFLRVSQ